MDPDEVKGALCRANPGAVVQTLRAGSANNEFLVEMLAAQTLQAQASGSLLARKPEIDLLLRFAGTTQISKAISEAGAKRGSSFLAVVAGQDEAREPAGFKGVELPRRQLARADLERVERAALLGTQKA